jgi:transcriptional regulator with XRE-family HTH domain
LENEYSLTPARLQAMDDFRRQKTSTFGEVIRQRRRELGLTQEELAERIGESVRQSDISRMERDYVVLPRRERLEALAAALEVTPGYLLLHSGWITLDELASIESSAANDVQRLVGLPSSGSPPSEDPATAPVRVSADLGREVVPGEPSGLGQAIVHAREVTRETEGLLRKTFTTLENARRARRPPRS